MGSSLYIRRIVITAMFAAVIYLTTAFLLHIPTGLNGGYIHLGDTFIYFAACVLPAPYAMAAAAIGAGLSDLTSPGGAVYVLPTIIIKSVMVLYFTRYNKRFFNKRNVSALVFAGLTGLFGYYIATSLMLGNFLMPLMTLPFDALQPIGSAVLFIIIARVFDRVNMKRHIENFM